MFYFAYGSNMSTVQMYSRCPGAVREGVGWLDGYTLVFNRKGSYRAGGVASIEREAVANARVYGVVWRVSDQDMARLDQIEDPQAYHRETLAIDLEDGRTVACETYISYPQCGALIPDEEYLSLIIDSAMSSGLPDAYISKLKAFRVLPRT